ncbi:hypothetical protein ZWY2020_035409 [Hordeum vulgare]|nr:hypothetical protein ZWY2020_035409 [Hordeum vulgare]
MFSYSRATQVWSSLGLLDAIESVLWIDRSGSVILKEILHHHNPDIPALGSLGFKEAITVGSWYIWWQRREAVKRTSVDSSKRSAFAILGLATNFQGAAGRPNPHVISWKKPAFNTYKLNIDVSFFPNGTGATTAVLRDHRGATVAGGGWPLTHILDAAIAEAIALQKGLALIEQLECSSVIIETDSLELVQAYNGVVEVWSPFTTILVDCFVKAHSIGSVSVQHCEREANSVAHNLARHAFISQSKIF